MGSGLIGIKIGLYVRIHYFKNRSFVVISGTDCRIFGKLSQ